MYEVINYSKDFIWENIKMIDYKSVDDDTLETFYNVTRQNLVEASKEDDIGFDLRYFECGKHGFTTLEKHEHAHIVMVIRGVGKIVVGKKVYDVKPFDLVIIPPWEPHQLINNDVEPFGFLCTVNGIRDKFKLLNKDEIDSLKENKETLGVIKVPESYYSSLESL
jgi:mannose-6-phosphate isomerase-like protein (cupin superfamily)